MALVRYHSIPRYNLVRRFDRLFDDFYFPGRFLNVDASVKHWRPKVDVYDNETTTVIKAELPGVEKENITVDVKGRVLTLRGERSSDNETKEGKTVHTERFRGSFERCFALPEDVNVEKITAEYADGVLKIEVPKPDAREPRKITVH